MGRYMDEKNSCYRDNNGRRLCTIENDTLNKILDNCKEDLKLRDTIDLWNVTRLLQKALEGNINKKDLTPSEQDAIKRIRSYIKFL